MNEIRKHIKKQEYLTNWLVSEPKQEELITKQSTFTAPIIFSEEHIDVVYPLRKEFLQERLKRKTVFDRKVAKHIYFPFENKRVEFSAMIKTPYYLSGNAESYLEAETAGEYEFELVTCGGVTIWLNQEEVESFLPFTRNVPSSKKIILPLRKGKNLLQVYFEDLAERDVYFYFQLKYLEGVGNIIQAIESNACQDEYDKAIEFINSISFTQDEFLRGSISIEHLKLEKKLPLEIRVNYSSFKDPATEKKLLLSFPSKYSPLAKRVLINEQCSTTKLFEVKEMASGIKNIELGIRLSNGDTSYKRFCISIFNEEKLNISFSKNLKKRKREMLDLLNESENEDITKALARLEINKNFDSYTKALLLDNIEIIKMRGDCADFRTAPLLIILYRYSNLLDEETQNAIQECFINFRYWIDEPGNDTMWYFSENHALLFNITQYLAGKYYPNEVFTASGRLGKEQEKIGAERIHKWFNEFSSYGFSEWNSTTYIPVDLIGFFTLGLLDDKFKDEVHKALDFAFEVISSHVLGNVFGSTYGRVYEKELKGFKCGEMSSIIKMAWNKGYFNYNNRVLVPFALSNYEPKESGRVQTDKGFMMTRYRQGKNAKIYTFKSRKYLMSSVEHFFPFNQGHQQHTFHILMGEKQSPIWINHPGEFALSGENRPSYWAGNGLLPDIYQKNNVAIIEYNLKGSELPFTHFYLPPKGYKKVKEVEHGFIVEFSESALLVHTKNPISFCESGATKNREVKVKGEQQLIFIKAISIEEVSDWNNLEKVYHRVFAKVNTDKKTMEDPQWGMIELKEREYKEYSPEKAIFGSLPSIS